MAVLTSQQLNKLYDEFATVDVTFTRDVIKTTLLYPKQVFIKCLGYQWPCILYASSMSSARVIASAPTAVKQVIAKANNQVSLRYSFLQRDKSDPISFFVNCRVTDFAPYPGENPDLNFISLSFSGRPADDLIERLGQLLEAHHNAQHRKEDRITLNPETLKELSINAKMAGIVIDHITRKCIIRDISFSGARIIIMGVPKFLLNKDCMVKLRFENPDENIDIPGKVIRFEALEGRSDIGSFVILFEEGKVPMEYKMRLSNFFKQQKNKKVLPPPQSNSETSTSGPGSKG